jgi:hypothetical protein
MPAGYFSCFPRRGVATPDATFNKAALDSNQCIKIAEAGKSEINFLADRWYAGICPLILLW